MAVTITQAKYKEVKQDGSIVLFHFQTNADIVVDGTSKKVPLITEVNNWNSIRSEVMTARGIAANLDARLNGIDIALQAANLLAAIKTVDGANSGLDADKVDGREVSDSTDPSTMVLWTSSKVQTMLDLKLDKEDVVTVATANRVLRLDVNGKLPASITGNAATATVLATGRKITLTGDATGNVTFKGDADVSLEVTVGDNTHNHEEVKKYGTTKVSNTDLTGNIVDFMLNNAVKSSIDENGNFSGKAANSDKLQNKTVDDTGTTTSFLWTAAKIISALGGKLDSTAISTLAQASGKLKVSGITLKWGTVSMLNTTDKIVSFGSDFTSAPWIVMHSVECSDFTFVCNRKPAATTTTQTEFICNKTLTTGTANVAWFAIGV